MYRNITSKGLFQIEAGVITDFAPIAAYRYICSVQLCSVTSQLYRSSIDQMESSVSCESTHESSPIDTYHPILWDHLFLSVVYKVPYI
jgi:hypothetical protein